tara:strand:- start:425 stop:847 length:423 start_codon:yes stop_codon:yes gene_type:complete
MLEDSDIALGVALPFGPGRSNFKLNYTTLDQAKTDLVMLLLTHKGERYMQPDFGTNLRRFVFDPNTRDTSQAIENEILTAIKFWLPFINIESINVDRSIENIDQYKINVSITFSVIDDIAEFTSVTFKFSSDGTVAVQNI